MLLAIIRYDDVKFDFRDAVGGGLGVLRGCSQPRKLTFYCIFGPLFFDCAVVVNPKFSRKKSIFWTKNQVFGQKFEFFSKILSSLQPRGRKFIKTVTLTKIFAKIVIFVQKCHFLGQKQPIFPQIFGAFGAKNARL